MLFCGASAGREKEKSAERAVSGGLWYAAVARSSDDGDETVLIVWTDCCLLPSLRGLLTSPLPVLGRYGRTEAMLCMSKGVRPGVSFARPILIPLAKQDQNYGIVKASWF